MHFIIKLFLKQIFTFNFNFFLIKTQLYLCSTYIIIYFSIATSNSLNTENNTVVSNNEEAII